MAAITTTGTLTAGNSRTFALAPGSALTLTLLPNCRVTVTETPETVSASDAGGNSPRTHSHQLAGVVTYGPYAMGGSVVVANASNSGSTVTWGRKDTVVSTDSTGTSLVSGDGKLFYLPNGSKRRTMARCISGRSNAVAASSTIWTGTGLSVGLTQHQRHALATHFDAVRIAIPNMHTSTVAGVKVVFGASNALGAYSSAPAANSSTGTTSAVPVPTETVSSTLSTWRAALFGGASSATLPVAIAASDIWPSWTWTDWCQIASVDRTDGGTYPILDLRIFIPVAASSITTAYTGASNQAWALWGRDDLFTSGRVARCWNQDVDGVTTPGDFTSTTTTPVMIPVIIQYISRTTGATLMVCGDSIAEGSTGPTYTNDSFAWRAALASADPIEVCNQGFGGATSIQATNRARTVLANVNPSHILAPAASTNNFGTTLGVRVSGEAAGSLGVLASLANEVDAKLGVYGFLPVTNAAKAYGTSDSHRITANALVAARAASLRATAVDLVGTVSGSTVSSQVEPNASYVIADGVHYNDAGNAAMATTVGRWLAAAG